MSIAKESRRLANYIIELNNDFTIYYPNNDSCYNHIGALFVDITLQAGLNYKTVVRPRVSRVLLQYPEAFTINKFQELVDSEGLENIIKWKHPLKLKRIQQLLDFYSKNNINTCHDLKIFLTESQNRQKFLELNGVGPKTLDYLMKLLNFDVVAVDRHIYSFVEMAQIENRGYDFTKKVVEYAADFLSISRTSLDYSIWNYMSKKENKIYIENQLRIEFVA